MPKIDMPFAALIETEEKISETYRELSEKAAQSNIRYFLRLFLNGHRAVIEKLKAYGKREVAFPLSDADKIASIWATQHLVPDESVDLNSLQSVLLFIAKTEEQSLGEFDDLMREEQDEGMLEYLGKIREEKITITTKADRLYHDMIESKIS